MKKISILIISILIFSTVMINIDEVKSVDVEIINFKTLSGSFGYMQGSLCDFGFQLRNNTTNSKIVTTNILVHGAFTTYLNISFEDTLEPSEILDKPSFQFNVAETGDITIEITNSYDSKTYTIVSYKFYKQSFTTNETKFYAGQGLISTCQMVNKGDSRAFKINLVLKDPQNMIRQTKTETATVPNEGILECTLNYTFLSSDRVGSWSVEMEISPDLHPNLKLPIEKLSVDFSQPTLDLVIETPSYFTIGEDGRFSFTLKNSSDISIFVPQIQVEIENMAGKGMLTEQVRCEINGVVRRYLYNVTLLPEGNVGSEIKYTVDINLDASLENEYIQEKWWLAGDYKTVVTVKTSVGSFLPYSQIVELRSIKPIIEPTLTVDTPVYVLSGEDSLIEVFFEFANPTKVEQDINMLYLCVAPPSGGIPAVNPETISNIHLSSWLNQGCVKEYECSFKPSRTRENKIITGIYTLYFFLDEEKTEELTQPLQIEIIEKDYDRKLNMIVEGVQGSYELGSSINAKVTVANVGVKREDYSLYVEVIKPTGYVEKRMPLGVAQRSIEPDQTIVETYNIPTYDLKFGNKTLRFYINYLDETEEATFPTEITPQRGLNFTSYDMKYSLSRASVYIGEILEVTVTIRNNDELKSFFEVKVTSNLDPKETKQSHKIAGTTDQTSDDPNTHTFKFSLTALEAELDAPVKVTVNDYALPTKHVTVKVRPEHTETPPPSAMSKFEMFYISFIICAIIIVIIFMILKGRRKKPEKEEIVQH